GEKLADERHGGLFTPHVLLHELFRLGGPRIVQDRVHLQADAAEDLIELFVSFVGMRGTFGRQRLRRVRLLGRKIVSEKFCEITLKVLLVESVIRLELFHQKIFSALSMSSCIKVHFKRRHFKTSHSKAATSPMKISSIISTGFTAAQRRARSW